MAYSTQITAAGIRLAAKVVGPTPQRAGRGERPPRPEGHDRPWAGAPGTISAVSPQLLLAAQGLHGLAAQGLVAWQGFAAAQGLHGLTFFLAAQGLQGVPAAAAQGFAAQGLQGLQAAICTEVSAA